MTYDKLTYLVELAHKHCKELVEERKTYACRNNIVLSRLISIQNCLYMASVGVSTLVREFGSEGGGGSPCTREEQAVSHTVCDFSFPLFGGNHERAKGDTTGVETAKRKTAHKNDKPKGVGDNRKTVAVG